MSENTAVEEERPDYSFVYSVLHREKDLKFRGKKLTLANKLQDQCCNVCAVGFDKITVMTERGMNIITCYGCGQSCHLYCYGLLTPIEISDFDRLNHAYFLCDRCRVDHKKDWDCVVCKQREGLKKRIGQTNDFVHPACALTTHIFECNDVLNLVFARKQGTQLPKKECAICHSPGASMECASPNCKKSAHFYCVLKEIQKIGGFNSSYSEKDRKGIWDFSFDFRNFVKQIESDSFPEAGLLPESVKTAATTMLTAYRQVEAELGAKTTRKKRGAAGSAAAAKGPDIVTEAFEKYNSRLESSAGKRNFAGGSMIVFCQDHRQEDSYCICRQTVEDQMVYCDSCSEWFHYGCVLSRDEMQQELPEKYLCAYCQEWTQKKFKAILKFQVTDTASVRDVLPTRYLRMQLMDFLVLAILAQRVLSLQKFLEHQFAFIARLVDALPFENVMSSKVSSMRERSRISEFMNFLFREHPEYKNPELFALKSSSEQHNDHLFEALTKVVKLFSDLEECQYFQNIKDSIVVLQKVHHLKEKKNGKVKKAEFKEHLSLIRRRSLEHFEECQWVISHWAQYKDWKTAVLSRLQTVTRKFDQIQSARNDVNFNRQDVSYVHFISEEIGFGGPVKSVKDFFLLMKKFRQWMNAFKISLVEWRDLLSKSFVFEVDWVRKAEDEAKALEAKLEEFKSDMQDEMQYSYNNFDIVEEYLTEYELLLLRKDEYEAAYEFTRKYKLFQHQFEKVQDLFSDLMHTNSESDESSGIKYAGQQPSSDLQERVSAECLDELLALGQELGAPESDLEFLAKVKGELQQQRERIEGVLKADGFNEQMKKKCQNELLARNRFDIAEVSLLEAKVHSSRGGER